jgi:anti-sigma regulatory factor (Ser/Thr protein kinase)
MPHGPGFDDALEMPTLFAQQVPAYGEAGRAGGGQITTGFSGQTEEGCELGDTRFTLRHDVRSVREARLRVRAIGDLPEHILTDAELVVSELVSNSLRHACLGDQDVIEVALERGDVRLIIVVDDHDGFSGTSGAHRPPRRSGGMGLKLLDAICEHWHAEAGRVVASLTI